MSDVKRKRPARGVARRREFWISRGHPILTRMPAMVWFKAMALPGFKVIPDPHPDDAEFNRSEGSDWWPNDVDIRGDVEMHAEFCNVAKERR